MAVPRADLNMASTFECSRNDVIATCGVIAAALAVALSGSPGPDIIAAGIIAAIFLRSAIRVIYSALPAMQTAHPQ